MPAMFNLSLAPSTDRVETNGKASVEAAAAHFGPERNDGLVGLLQEHGKAYTTPSPVLRYSFVQQPKGHEADGGRSMGEGDGSPPHSLRWWIKKATASSCGLDECPGI